MIKKFVNDIKKINLKNKLKINLNINIFKIVKN